MNSRAARPVLPAIIHVGLKSCVLKLVTTKDSHWSLQLSESVGIQSQPLFVVQSGFSLHQVLRVLDDRETIPVRYEEIDEW